MGFDEWFEKNGELYREPTIDERCLFEAGAASRQAEIDELQKRIDVCEKLRDSQFDKLWSLTQAIEVARNGADEDFDLFLNHLSNILKGNTNEH